MPTAPNPIAVPMPRAQNPLCTVCEMTRLSSSTSQQAGVCWRCRQDAFAKANYEQAKLTFATERVREAMVFSVAPHMLAMLKETLTALPDSDLRRRIETTVRLAEGEWVESEPAPVPVVPSLLDE